LFPLDSGEEVRLLLMLLLVFEKIEFRKVFIDHLFDSLFQRYDGFASSTVCNCPVGGTNSPTKARSRIGEADRPPGPKLESRLENKLNEC
jgi:hypothetical protein